MLDYTHELQFEDKSMQLRSVLSILKYLVIALCLSSVLLFLVEPASETVREIAITLNLVAAGAGIVFFVLRASGIDDDSN